MGALQIDGEYVHRNISDVAEAIVKYHGRDCLKHLDSDSQSNWDDYFAINGSGDGELVPESFTNNVRRACSCLENFVDGHYQKRFNGDTRIDPYDEETKDKLCGEGLELRRLVMPKCCT